MTYSHRPTASGDTLFASRDPIRTNFIVIQDRFDENHFDIDGGVGGGKHKFLQLPEIPNAEAPTIPATAVNEGGVYTQVLNGNTELYFRRENNGNQVLLSNQVNAAVSFIAGASAVGGITPDYQYNIRPNVGPNFGVEKRTVSAISVGNYRIRFQNPMFSANYIVLIQCEDLIGTANANNHTAKVIAGSRTTAQFDIQTNQVFNNVVQDPVAIMITVIGG